MDLPAVSLYFSTFRAGDDCTATPPVLLPEGFFSFSAKWAFMSST